MPQPVGPTTITVVGVDISCLTSIGFVREHKRAGLLPDQRTLSPFWMLRIWCLQCNRGQSQTHKAWGQTSSSLLASFCLAPLSPLKWRRGLSLPHPLMITEWCCGSLLEQRLLGVLLSPKVVGPKQWSLQQPHAELQSTLSSTACSFDWCLVLMTSSRLLNELRCWYIRLLLVCPSVVLWHGSAKSSWSLSLCCRLLTFYPYPIKSKRGRSLCNTRTNTIVM